MVPQGQKVYIAPDGKICPRVAKFLTGTGADHALYARTPQFNQTNCIDVLGLFQHSSNASFGAWQYM